MKVWDSASYTEEFMQNFLLEEKENIFYEGVSMQYHEWDAGTKQLFVKVDNDFSDEHFQNLQNALQKVTSKRILVSIVKRRVTN